MAGLAVFSCRSRRRTSPTADGDALASIATAVLGRIWRSRAAARWPRARGPPAGLQVGQQHLQPAQDPGALGDQVVATVAEQAEDHCLVLEGDRAQLPVVDGGRGDRAGVGQVGLAAAAAGQQPGRAASLAGTSRTGSPAAASSWAMGRPRPLAPPPPSTAQARLCPGQQLPARLGAGRHGQLPEESAVGSRTTAVRERLCGSMPM